MGYDFPGAQFSYLKSPDFLDWNQTNCIAKILRIQLYSEVKGGEYFMKNGQTLSP